MRWRRSIRSGAQETRIWTGNSGNRIYRANSPEIFESSTCSSMFICRKRFKNICAQNCSSHIPLERFNRVELEYPNEFVQNLMYAANRCKEDNAYKFQSTITRSIYHETTIYKFKRTLQWTYYRIPNIIGTITSFDSQPWWSAAVDSACFKLQMVKTEAAWALRRWMMTRI